MKIYDLLAKLSFIQIEDSSEKHKMFHKTYVNLENTDYPFSVDVDVTIHSTMDYDYDFEIKINNKVETIEEALALKTLLKLVIADNDEIGAVIDEMNEELDEQEDEECSKL